MQYRITYRNEIFIKGNSLDEIKKAWENANIEPDISKDEHITSQSFIEVVSVEDENYNDLTEFFKQS